jgi:hypothetical protein
MANEYSIAVSRLAPPDSSGIFASYPPKTTGVAIEQHAPLPIKVSQQFQVVGSEVGNENGQQEFVCFFNILLH